jgi:tetratricopeptide (TPR) repeat protein
MKKGSLAWLLALLLGTSPLAADAIPTEIVLARALFAEARMAEDVKDWPLAASKLQEAIAIKETGGLRFHLAYCEEQQGMLVEALVDYERSDDLTAGTTEEFRAQLPAKRESLRRRIPTITLLVPPKPPNQALTVDGHTMPSAVLGKPIPLNPGHHTLVLTAPEHAAFTTQVSLNETDAVVANAILAPLPKRPLVSTLKPSSPSVASALQPTPDISANNGWPTRTYVLIGEAAVALGALGVGIGYTLQASSKDELAARLRQQVGSSNACGDQPAHPEQCAALQRANDDGKTGQFIARIGFIGAGVAAASFVGTLILWRPPAKVAIIPSFAPGAAQLSVAAHF